MTETIAVKKVTAVISGSLARLRAMGKPLQRVLTFSLADDSLAPAKNVCAAIERGLLSIAYGSRILSRITLKGCKLYPLEEKYPTPEGLASSAALTLNTLGASKAEMTLSIPKAWTVIKIAEFPSTVRDNLSDVVSYEMDRLTPFGPGEAFYDFRIVREDSEKLTLLVVAVKTDLIGPYLEALREKGFNVSRVTVNLSAVGALCRYANKCADSVFIKISEKEYEGAVFLGGFITGAFAGSFGSDDDREKLDTVMAEMEPLLDSARKEGKSPQVIVSVKDKNSALGEMMKLRMTLPFKILEETGIPLGLSKKEISYEAVGGVIESLWPPAGGLNLLGKGRQTKEKPPLALTVILAIGVVAVWALSLVAPVKIEGTRLREMDRQIAMRKDEIKKIEALKKDVAALESDIAAINNFKGNRPMALNILKELTSVLPKTAWLTRTRITETTVDIEGYAGSATELIPKLEASPYFRKTEFASPTFRDARMNADRFTIKMEIEGVKKTEGEKTNGRGKPKSEKK
ncbi:MAG: PilN domain-containing protein [Nitrospirae bacterium]|nr:PilN domain-containing protein [Nitrospirota bacterium]MCL5421329.1 PilN domain-containing protein [Nitrospirota bacterium]